MIYFDKNVCLIRIERSLISNRLSLKLRVLVGLWSKKIMHGLTFIKNVVHLKLFKKKKRYAGASIYLTLLLLGISLKHTNMDTTMETHIL